MTPSELQVIESRANAATPGPWVTARDAAGHEVAIAHVFGSTEYVYADVGFIASRRGDAEFIARSRADIDLLTAEVRRLQSANAHLVEDLKDANDVIRDLNAELVELAEQTQAGAVCFGDDLAANPTSFVGVELSRLRAENGRLQSERDEWKRLAEEYGARRPETGIASLADELEWLDRKKVQP